MLHLGVVIDAQLTMTDHLPRCVVLPISITLVANGHSSSFHRRLWRSRRGSFLHPPLCSSIAILTIATAHCTESAIVCFDEAADYRECSSAWCDWDQEVRSHYSSATPTSLASRPAVNHLQAVEAGNDDLQVPTRSSRSGAAYTRLTHSIPVSFVIVRWQLQRSTRRVAYQDYRCPLAGETAASGAATLCMEQHPRRTRTANFITSTDSFARKNSHLFAADASESYINLLELSND